MKAYMTKTKKLRVGFIGCGRHATKVLYPSLRYSHINLVAVCDLDERLAKRNAQWFGAENYYTDYQRMLSESQLDAVIIVTGPASHASLAGEVLSRDIPVFIEKPPAYTLAEAEDLLELSMRKGIPVTVGMMKRWAPAYQRVKAIIAENEFGAISHIQATFRVGNKLCSGYALLLDAGIHILDLVDFLGGGIDSIQCEKYQGEIGIAYALTLRFSGGAIGNVHISDQGSWSYANESVEITGCGAFVRAENLTSVSYTRKDGTISVYDLGFSIPQNQNNSLFIQGYAHQFQAWSQALLSGNEPESTLEDSCRAIGLIKTLEPDQEYSKKPQHFPHWQAEEAWLNVED